MQPGIIILVLGLLTGAHVYSLSTTHIEGTVKGVPNYNNLNGAKAVLIKTSTNARVDSTHTNSNGWYQLNTVWTQIQEQLQEKESRMYPNPSQGVINIDFFSADKDNYTLIMNDQLGRQCFATQIPVERGNSTITLKGGNEGVYFITLTDGENTHRYTSMITTGTGSDISLAINSNGGSKLKSTLDEPLNIGDEVKIEFTKNGYLLGDTTFILGATQIVNKNLQQIPLTFTTTLHPYLESGEPVTVLAPGWSTTIAFPPAPQGPGTKTYSPNGNNEIIISENLYPLNGELGTVVMHHDTSNYTLGGIVNGVLPGIVLRVHNQPTNVPNLGQSEMPDLIPAPTATISLDSLNGKTNINYYMLRKKAETQPGVWHDMTAQNIRGLMASSGGGAQAGKFIDLPYNVADSLLIITADINLTSGTPVSTTNLNRIDNEESKILNLYDLANNDNITPRTAVGRSHPGGAMWNKAQSRGFVNTIVLYFYQGTPANMRTWKSDYTYNGELRLDYCESMNPEAATNGQLFEENYSATTGIEEGSGALTPFIYISSTGNPTQLAAVMAQWTKLVDLGTGVSKKDNINITIPKELLSYTEEGHPSLYFKDLESFSAAFPEFKQYKHNYEIIEKKVNYPAL